MIIHLVRHGRTEANVLARSPCPADEALDACGRQQAQDLALALADHHFDQIWCSTLPRARDTLAPLVHQQPATASRVCYEPSLCEGRFNLSADTPLDPPRWLESEFGRHPAPDETVPEFRSRVHSIIQRLSDPQQCPAGHHILIISHGHFIREFLNMLSAARVPIRYPIDNVSLSILERHDNVERAGCPPTVWSIRQLNGTIC